MWLTSTWKKTKEVINHFFHFFFFFFFFTVTTPAALEPSQKSIFGCASFMNFCKRNIKICCCDSAACAEVPGGSNLKWLSQNTVGALQQPWPVMIHCSDFSAHLTSIFGCQGDAESLFSREKNKRCWCWVWGHAERYIYIAPSLYSFVLQK